MFLKILHILQHRWFDVIKVFNILFVGGVKIMTNVKGDSKILFNQEIPET